MQLFSPYNVGRSVPFNNDPRIIAEYYMEAITTTGGMKVITNVLCFSNVIMICFSGVPTIIRADRGTENSIVAFLQPAFRHDHTDYHAGERSFQYGRSSANQVSQLADIVKIYGGRI